MKKYEIESFFKSFLLFFILLGILLVVNFWHKYQVDKVNIDESIHLQMKLCAFTLECPNLSTDFVEKNKDEEENILYKNNGFYSYYKVPKSDKYLIKVMYTQQQYILHLAKLKSKIIKRFFFYLLISGLLSLLFAMYALFPLRKALRTNEEFVKDILHDFNTPISSMRVNIMLLLREIGENKKMLRLENNLETILSLQDNLQIFLQNLDTQVETFSLEHMITHRMEYFETLYPNVLYIMNIQQEYTLRTNKEAFVRIIDNLLSNAGKYNKTNGTVNLFLKEGTLSIVDTGKGIEQPKKVFRRYYKEQDRGIGIGLHIVKKLCDELKINITIKSQKNLGTTVHLNISSLLLEC